MKTETVWSVPPSVTDALKKVPEDKPVALLLRHSVRPDLTLGDAGFSLPITEDGERIAKELGQMLGDGIGTIYSSPFPRCIQTAQAIAEGAGKSAAPVEFKYLGDPGVFIVDEKTARINWNEENLYSTADIITRLNTSLPGMTYPYESSKFLARNILEKSKQNLKSGNISLFITHDSLIAVIVSQLTGRQYPPDNWPLFLEGAFFWEDDDGMHILFKNHHFDNLPAHLNTINEKDVLDFIQRKMAWTFGTECQARFFVAGGVFKEISTGNESDDIDIWCPSEDDMNKLVRHLMFRGAEELDKRDYTVACNLDGNIIEVKKKFTYPTLESVLSRFDIGLSAIGAEYDGRGGWKAKLHPLVNKSLKRKQILLLKPLVNWKFGLSTLERMRHYAKEFGFESPEEEEEEVWTLFYKQSEEMQKEMLRLFQQTSRGEMDVEEEFLRRYH